MAQILFQSVVKELAKRYGKLLKVSIKYMCTAYVIVHICISTDEITKSNTTEISLMKAEYYILKYSLDSALHPQDFFHSTNVANSLMTGVKLCIVNCVHLFIYICMYRYSSFHLQIFKVLQT